MIIYLAKIFLLKNKKEPTGVMKLNRPVRLKGKEPKLKYVPPANADEIMCETTCVGTEESVMADISYLKRCVGNKKLPGKYSDYRIVRVEFVNEIGVTCNHYGDFPKPVEVLRDYPNPWPDDPGFDIKKHGYKKEVAVTVNREVPKFNFPPIKLSK